jgi:hypothetical protein
MLITVDPQAIALWKRTLDYLESRDQKKIEALTAKVTDLTARLHNSTSDLKGSLDDKENS